MKLKSEKAKKLQWVLRIVSIVFLLFILLCSRHFEDYDDYEEYLVEIIFVILFGIIFLTVLILTLVVESNEKKRLEEKAKEIKLTLSEINEYKAIKEEYGDSYIAVDYDNLFKLAFEEMESDQYEEAEKHFDMYFLKNVDEWKPAFFRAYCKCHTGRIGDIPSQAGIFEGAFQKAYNKIMKIENENERIAGLCILIEYLNKQADYFISNGKRVGGLFGSATVGINTISAANSMLKYCTSVIKPACANKRYLLKEFKNLESNKKGNNAIIIIVVIAVVAGILWWII